MEYNFDIDKITEQFKAVIKHSQHIRASLNVENIIADWLKAKEFFIDKLGGNLIYQSEELLHFHLDENSRRERLSRFIYLVRYQYNNKPLGNFLSDLKLEDFYNNKTSRTYVYENITIPNGIKIIKSFKFFENNLIRLERIQNEASRLIQEDMVSGYLCLSVHPLDFLSASENVHNWRSCYALDGEYRTGSLNYLMDSSTVICYLRAEKEAILPHFPKSVPWNSKKWRAWLFFSNDYNMLFTGKQYPFTCDLGLQYIKDQILPKVGLGNWYPFYESAVDRVTDQKTKTVIAFCEKYYPVGCNLKSLSDLMISGPYVYVYNDVIHSNSYTPYYTYRQPERPWWSSTGATTTNTFFLVGEKCRCPICGENQIDFSDLLSCGDCSCEPVFIESKEYYCDVCGSSFPEEDMHDLFFSDSKVCEFCYENETSMCQICETSDLTEVMKYKDGFVLCPDCYSTKERKFFYGKRSNCKTTSHK